MSEACDHTSVGVIIENENDQILIIEREQFPFGLAAPAGHIFPHGSSENAAIVEVEQEVGLIIAASSLEKVIEGRRINNHCKRSGGDHHVWDVYRTRIAGQTVQRSLRETKSAGWYTTQELQQIADRTQNGRLRGEFEPSSYFEDVWLNFFIELGVVRRSLD